MTRETKAGLVVSCSFLCLVGVVLYSKLHGPKAPLTDEYAAGAVEAPPAPTALEDGNLSESVLPFGSDNTGSASEKQAATTGNGNAFSKTPANIAGTGPVVGDQTGSGDIASASKSENSVKEDKGASASSTSIYAIPDPVGEDKNPAPGNSSNPVGVDNKIAKTGATLDPIQEVKETKNGTDVKGEKGPQDTSKASWVIPPNESTKDKNSEAAKNVPTKTDDTPIVSVTEGADTRNTKDIGSLATDRKTKDPKAPADQDPPPIPKGLHDPFQSLPELPAGQISSPTTANRSPRDASIRKTTVSPPGAVAGIPKASAPDRRITGISTSPPNGDPKSLSGTVATTTPNLIQPGLSSPTNGVAVTSANQVATNSGQSRNLTPGVMPSPRTLSLPPAGDTAPEANVRLGPPTGNLHSNPPGQDASASTTPTSSLPPSDQVAQGPAPSLPGSGIGDSYQTPGAAPASTISPVRAPAAQVDSYDEETYLCKQGDTFAGISTKFYQSEKYSQALLLFNRNHPRATAGVRQDPPSLAAGQPIYIPPLRILEKRYPTAVPDHGSTEQPTNPISATSDAGSSALPSAPKEIPGGTGPMNYTVPDTRNPQTPGANPVKPAAPRGERTYVVPRSGQTFWEISRQTLGNPNRWSEIYRLNDKIDPKYPVPGSTTLRMPADARLDQPSPLTEKVN
jgi:nucleoid-associated protein YgaU